MFKYPFSKFPPTSSEIESWWKIYQRQNPILEKQGTWLHRVARVIHSVAKITALIPNFSKKIYAPKAFLDPILKQKLEQKFELYKQLIKTHQDQHGFIMTEECDSLLFSSLMSCVLKDVNIKSAQDSEGWWYRRPLSHPPCYPDNSGSSISRDMITGLIWYFYFNKDLSSAEQTFELYKKHNFVMGQGDPTRLILMPGLEATLAEIIHKLGGKNRWFSRHQLQTWPKSLTGYQIHLLMLHSLLLGKLFGYTRANVLEAYKTYAENNPCNALHQFSYSLYIDGNMNSTAELLLNEAWWPSDRLPRRQDRKNDWITSRDCDDNYLPATDSLEEEHSGGDFLFTTWLVLESLK